MESMGVKFELMGDSDFRIYFDHDALSDIDVKLSKLPKEKMYGVARSILAASAIYCMAGATYLMLKARGVEARSVTASSSVQMGKDKSGKVVVEGINLEVDVDIPEENKDVLDHCVGLLDGGCLITRSLKRGIKVKHSISCK